ncbi:hypothetical protein Tco_0447881 [Tanacetum coccineum]
MGRDTIQLENAVSTISKEYLLKFTSKYGIPESLHPELPGPKEPIVEFLEGKVGVYTKFFDFANYHMDLFNLISASNPTKVKTGTRPRAAHEVPLLTATASRVIDMEDTVVASGSSGTPPALEKSPLDFANEDPPQMITERGGMKDQVQDGLSHEIPPVENVTTTEVILEPCQEKEVAAMGPLVNKRRGKRGNDEVEANAPPKMRAPGRSYYCEERERSRAAVLCETIAVPRARHCLIFQGNGHRDPHQKCCYHGGARPVLHGESEVREIDLLPIRGLVARRYLSARVRRDQQLPLGHPGRVPRHGKSYSTAKVAMGSQLRLRFEHEVRLLKKATAKIARRDQRIQAREEEIKKLDQEIKSPRTVEAEVYSLRNQTKNLEILLEAELDMKKDAEAKNAGLAKELESLCVQVEQRCVEMDARLDKLSVDFDEELYPHMPFAVVLSAGLVKSMSKGLKHSIEHGKAGRDLAAVEAYDLEADSKYVKALQDLKDLKYPLVDQLERLKDASMELIMASLYLESDSREDTPQWIIDLCPSSSQLKIPIYPEVCDPEDPWTFKEEMLLEDAITANISRARKKKKCRVICRTHGIGSAHHAISDGIPVSVPTPRVGNFVGGCRHTDRGG